MIDDRRLTIDDLNLHNRDNLMGHLGMEFTHIEEGYAEMEMPVVKRNTQMVGLLHGGASIALAETIAGLASLYIVYPKMGCVGMQMSASHISSAEQGEVIVAKAKLLHRGGRTHVWDVNLYAKGDGRLISSVKATNAIVPIPEGMKLTVD